MEIRPQPPLTRQSAPTAFALRNITDRKARGRLRAAATAEAVGTELEWTDAGGWRYQLERPPVVTISPKDIHRAAATVDLRVFNASNTLIFRDRVHAWDGFPVLVPDGTEHEEDDGPTGKVRVSNFREALLEAARIDLAHTVRVVTKDGKSPWVKAKPGTISTFYSGTGDGYLTSSSTTYSTARSGGTISVNTAGTAAFIGQAFLFGTDYRCMEGVVFFDTSALGSGATISAATLSLMFISNDVGVHYTINARMAAGTTGGSLTTADWIGATTLSSLTLGASRTTNAMTADVYYDLTESGTNLQTSISKTGTTDIYISSSRHENGNTPTATDEDLGFYSGDASGTTQDPKLVVTHAPQPEASSISVDYGSYNRTGPSNTPWTLNFTGSGGLTTYQVRTGSTSGAGTQVATGAAADGANNKTIAYNASGITQGDQTLYLFVSNDSGSTWSSGYSFTLKRDDSVSAPSSISHTPNPVLANKQYSVTFNAPDTYSTGTNEMSYQVRTASGGGGTLVGSGSFTQGNGRTTSTHTDSGLVGGPNNRYLRILDGANNVAETLFEVTLAAGSPKLKRTGGIPGMRPGKAPGNPSVW